MLLDVRSLSYAVNGLRIVDGVSFSLSYGEVMVLVGPNGAGKSTLLGLLAGDLRPAAGEALLEGVSLTQLSALEQARSRAVLRQRLGVALPFTAYEVALMGRHPRLKAGVERPVDHAITRDALASVEMLPCAGRAFPTLSGGEQTRVSMARVLAQQAPLLLLDEPTAALDLRHQHGAMHLARAIAAQGGAVLAVLHDLNLAAWYADRIGVLHRGRLVACGSPWEVLRPEVLGPVYGVTVVVMPHPHANVPVVFSLPNLDAAQDAARSLPAPERSRAHAADVSRSS